MKIIAAAAGVLFLTLCSVSFAQEVDKEGAKDHPLLSRIPGYYICDQSNKDFDSYTSPYIETDNVWEGKMTKTDYTVKEGSKEFSFIQIVRNYENAVKKLKGKILLSDSRILNARIDKNGGVTYVSAEAFNEGRNYTLIIVEKKTMDDEVTIDAAALNRGIAEAGKIALYGIYFDTGKSVVKPESKQLLDEIVKFLKINFKMKLLVIGHTDIDGVIESNMKLSADRAAAVVKALIENGISATRLKSAGVGPYCPVGTNRTEEGKAQNRRVELVEMIL